MNKQKIATLILAGKRKDDEFADSFGVVNKAFIKLKDKFLIEHVLESLSKAQLPKPYLISVTKDQEDYFREKLSGFEVEFIANPNQASAVSGIISGITRLSPGQDLLVTTADNPLLSQRILEAFLQNEEASGAEFTVGVVNGQAGLVQKMPKLKRTWHKINPNLWLSGANLFLFKKPSPSGNTIQTLQKLESLRKDPIAFCRVIAKVNFVFLLKYLLKLSSLEECNQACTKTVGLTINLKPLPYPEACIDVDKAEDFELAEKILQDPDFLKI